MKSSAARRVQRIISDSIAFNPSRPVTVQFGWSHVLGVLEADSADQQTPPEAPVIEVLAFVQEEVRAVREYFDSYPDAELTGKYSDMAIKTAQELFSARRLAEDWNQFRTSYLSSEHLGYWAWMASVMPAEDEIVTAEGIAALESDLVELERAANASGVPADVRLFALRQVSIIRRALRKYKAAGKAAFSEVVGTVVGELVSSEAVVRSARASDEGKAAMRGVGAVWERAAKFGDGVDKINRAYVAISGLALHVHGKVLEFQEWAANYILPGD